MYDAIAARHDDPRCADADAHDNAVGLHNDVALFAFEVTTAQFHRLIHRIGHTRQSVTLSNTLGATS